MTGLIEYVRRQGSAVPPAATPAPKRSDLEALRGTYIPGRTPDTVGVPAIAAASTADWTDVEADSLGRIYLDTPNTTYKHVRFWGSVIPRAAGINIFESEIAGPDPRIHQSRAIQTGCIVNYGSNPPHLNVEDTLIDGYLWNKRRGVTITLANGKVAKAYGGLYGLHGSNVTMKRCIVRNVTDATNIVGPNNNTDGRADNAYTDVLDSWLYKCDWANGIGSTPEGYHSDGGQANTGKNVRYAYCLIGVGPVDDDDPDSPWVARDDAGYDLPSPAGDNTGGDFWNSCFMIQQEKGLNSAGVTTTPSSVSTDAGYFAWVSNWTVEECWLAGGAGTVQVTGKNGNDLSTLTIRNNKLLRRNTTVASHGILNGDGYYILRVLTAGAVNATITGNKIWDWLGSIAGTATASPIYDKTA